MTRVGWKLRWRSLLERDPNRMSRWQQISGEGSEGSMRSGRNMRDGMGDQRRH